MTAAKKRALNAGAWLVSAERTHWEESGASSAHEAARGFARDHKLTSGFVFVRDSNGREQRFMVLPKKKRTPVTGTVKS